MLHADTRAGTLYLTIDTPRSPVNVFTPQTGERLVEELGKGVAQGVKAVVLRSDKPASFINGVGLLLAASSRSEAALAEAGRIRGFYEALAASPVPTIAAIRGNCYGCGLELALACDLRIAEHTPATRFRMPEVNDYGFMPLFGGTQRLPRLVGADAALDLIVFGGHLRADEAHRLGLVDVLAPPGGLDRAVQDALRSVQKASRPLRSRGPGRRVQERIAALPKEQRDLAKAAVRLAKLSAEPGNRGMRSELEVFRETVASRGASSAMGFFFVRQAAKLHGIGTAEYGAPAGVRAVVRGEGPGLRVLQRWLAPQPRHGRALTFAGPGARATGAVAARAGQDPALVGASAAAAARIPLRDARIPPIELVGEDLRDLFLVLENAGFDPVVTRAKGTFLSDRMLAAVARSSPRKLLQGGFARADRGRGRDDPELALAEVALDALAAGEVSHPAQLELLAHSVGGFPVTRGSLLRHVDAERLGELERRVGRARMRAAFAGGRGFYSR